MRIAMIGGGPAGPVLAACFAELGTGVAIVGTDPGRLGMRRKGRMAIYEPGLERAVVDLRRMFAPSAMHHAGLVNRGVGRAGKTAACRRT